MPNLGKILIRLALFNNLIVFRADLQRDCFGTVFPSNNQLKSQPYKSRISQLEYQAKLQLSILTRALAWLIEGLNISESWIEQVPDASVADYLNFRQGNLNTINAPYLQGAPQPIHPSNAPRLQGAPQSDTSNIVDGIHRLRITEFEEM